MAGATFGFLTPENVPLFTDLYELRMMQAYDRQDHNPRATFSLFFRDLPPNRGYMLAAGLEQALQYIENISFGERAIDFLQEQGFDDEFLAHLESLEFTGPDGRTPGDARTRSRQVAGPGTSRFAVALGRQLAGVGLVPRAKQLPHESDGPSDIPPDKSQRLGTVR
ncbi:MAG: hypothetical protein V5A55_06265 [Halovenus sp.]